MQSTLLPPEEKKTVELIKHTAAIHIKTNLSLVDRKALNILLKNAYDELGKEKYHTIRLSEVKTLIGWNSKNYEDLKKSLRKLVNSKIEWNILGQDRKNKWFISSLLASASIAGGKCTYSFSSHLQDLLKNPNIYGKINLLSQNQFRSKYSLILWEYLSSHLSASKKSSAGTSWIKIKDYRDLMGINDKAYSSFKEFSYNLVRNPIKEINEVSEIEAIAEYQKINNEYSAVRFAIIAKDEEKERNESIKLKLLNFCKLSSASTDQILQKYSEEQIAENILYIETMKGSIKNMGAYSFNAIQKDLRLDKSEKEPEKRKEEPEEIKTFRNALKGEFMLYQLDYDMYLRSSEIIKIGDQFLMFVTTKISEYLRKKHGNILEKLKIKLEIKND